MSSLGGYGDNLLVAVEYIEYGLGGIKHFSEAMIVHDPVFVLYVAIVGI